MPTTLDPWNENDLIRVLRTFAQLLDDRDRVTAAEVRDALDTDDTSIAKAQKRLRGLGLLDTSPIPKRLGDGDLSTGRVLTQAGIHAAISGKLAQ